MTKAIAFKLLNRAHDLLRIVCSRDNCSALPLGMEFLKCAILQMRGKKLANIHSVNGWKNAFLRGWRENILSAPKGADSMAWFPVCELMGTSTEWLLVHWILDRIIIWKLACNHPMHFIDSLLAFAIHFLVVLLGWIWRHRVPWKESWYTALWCDGHTQAKRQQFGFLGLQG